MSSTMTISNRPSIFNWADDDEDDFDFEAWKSTTNTSAPTLECLPALQSQVEDEDESLLTVYTPIIPQRPSTPEPILAAMQPCLQEDIYAHYSATKALVWHALEKPEPKPAYFEMSAWDNDVICFDRRINYTHNWNKGKEESGLDCRFTAIFRGSPLRQVERAGGDLEEARVVQMDETEVEVNEEMSSADIAINTELTTLDKVENILAITSCTEPLCIVEDFNEDVQVTSFAPVELEEPVKPVFKISHMAFDTSKSISPTQEAHETECTVVPDEGYFSNESRSNSPTISSDGNQPLHALDKVPNNTTPTPNTPVSDTKVYNIPTVTAIMNGAATTGWSYLTSRPWTTTSILAAGIVLGGTLHFVRRR